MPRQSATSHLRLKSADVDAKLWELRKAGASYSQIQQQLGISKTSISLRIKRMLAALRERNMETADDVRRIDLDRLDAALLAIWPQVRSGHHGAIDRMIKIMERRAKLMGLDAPTRSEVTGADGASLIDPLIERLLSTPESQRAAHDILAHFPLKAEGHRSPVGDAGGDGNAAE